MCFQRCFLASAFLLTTAVTSRAATVHITPTVTEILNQDLTPVDPALILGPELLAVRAEPYLLKVAVNVMTDGLDDTHLGFHATAFNVRINGTGTAARPLGLRPWFPDNSNNTWTINENAGSPDDLGPILLYASSEGGVTQGAGDNAGWFHIEFPCTRDSSTSADILAEFGLSTYHPNGTQSTAGNTAVGGSTGAFSCGLPGVPGDTNGDRLVDLEDLNNVRNNFGGGGLGDTDGDTDVDLDDLNAVRNNFGAAAGAQAVPEPAGIALMLMGAVGALSYGWRPRSAA